MSASQLISEDIPTISPMETVSKALRIIDDYKYEHLPIVSEGMQYVGIVSESELRDAVNSNVLIESLQVERP
ncbi:MAG: CBS domain-containing protein, partial [Bacteroidales bacterium]|nr:CBS domain-containing protein [Bacteroidales bacterium]